MGTSVSTQKMGESESSLAIDAQLREDRIQSRKVCRILLLSLNSDESSLWATVQRMNIIHQDGYSLEERNAFKTIVYTKLIQSAKDLVLAVKKVGVDWGENINQTYARQVLDYEVKADDSFVLSPDIVLAIESLWADPIIATVMEHSSEFYLMDSASYFFSHVRRIGERHYIPNESDMVHARARPMGITETRFTMGQLLIHMVSMRDEGSNRKKWIHSFEGVTSLLYYVDLDAYDQISPENGRNQLEESLALFESVVNSRWFLQTSIILFLNKTDVFEAKLSKVPLESHFPDYTGGPDINKAAEYILWRFTQVNRAHLSLYPHLIQETDPCNIRLVFAAVKETLLQNAALWSTETSRWWIPSIFCT